MSTVISVDGLLGFLEKIEIDQDDVSVSANVDDRLACCLSVDGLWNGEWRRIGRWGPLRARIGEAGRL
jgi:hypothetical protein